MNLQAFFQAAMGRKCGCAGILLRFLLWVGTAAHAVPPEQTVYAQTSVRAGDEGAVQGRTRTGVSFRTSDAELQRLFDAAEAKAASNIVQFTPGMKILVEGGGYGNAWIETQPMGGEMYAKRNLEVALNNQLIFLLGQRADGRLPGMVISGQTARRSGQVKNPPEGMVWFPQADLLADYEMFQGYCFPDPAWRMYFWMGKDRAYLRRLYAALEAHDDYLWRTHDSNGDGLLEAWCVWDTGEDNGTRLIARNAPTRWPFDFAPAGDRLPDPQDAANFQRYWVHHYLGKLSPPTREQVLVPIASMDVMAYSYDGRATLAKVARELENGREVFWRQQAGEVRRRLIASLWDPARHACFDRDRTGKRLDELIHNNLRCMYYGVFTQEMADAFIRDHLLNPDEFWTPMPLPSIAVKDPLFRNDSENNWSGQPEGLTYQRAIRALENYGHFAEVTLLGRKLIEAVGRGGNRFTQQFDPFTGMPTSPGQDRYGPTILSVLEYISRLHGIHLDVENGRVLWSALADRGKAFTYAQHWGNRTWTLDCDKGRFIARLNGKELFSCTQGVRVATDLEGNAREVVGIESTRQRIILHAGGSRWELSVTPNQVYRLDGIKPVLLRAAPFDYPFMVREKTQRDQRLKLQNGPTSGR